VKPTFLTVSDVLLLHEAHLQRYGGSAGIRDAGLLDSAVSQARTTFSGLYLHEDLAAMAAAYLFSIVKNHPFIDGNKRAGLAAALTFLDLNGIAIDHSSDLLYDATMGVAEGRLEKEGLAEILRGLVSSTG
jgi:death-on-curing protein